MDRLGLAEVDDQGRIQGKAMVVGATGAIGSVCARLLALASDELWLVSPETAKLLALKHEIERENPRAPVHVAATPDEHLGDMDVIVTATSGAGKRVLDIMAVKPGCVITDVARPLDLSAEDVAKRPDVLVIESGEIELPGDVRMRNIGLPPGVVYACMAETVVLALEGRYETFTVGRNIEWEKVKEIYRLGLKHGMKLAAISGVNGVFTDDDFAGSGSSPGRAAELIDGRTPQAQVPSRALGHPVDVLPGRMCPGGLAPVSERLDDVPLVGDAEPDLDRLPTGARPHPVVPEGKGQAARGGGIRRVHDLDVDVRLGRVAGVAAPARPRGRPRRARPPPPDGPGAQVGEHDVRALLPFDDDVVAGQRPSPARARFAWVRA